MGDYPDPFFRFMILEVKGVVYSKAESYICDNLWSCINFVHTCTLRHIRTKGGAIGVKLVLLLFNHSALTPSYCISFSTLHCPRSEVLHDGRLVFDLEVRSKISSKCAQERRVFTP